jgi:hypothetical protein
VSCFEADASLRVEGERSLAVFRRSCIRLPGLKCGERFFGTVTLAPFFGFRAGRPRRTRTLNVPMPRISTRSPRVSAVVIASSMMFTILLASPRRRFVPRSDTVDQVRF